MMGSSDRCVVTDETVLVEEQQVAIFVKEPIAAAYKGGVVMVSGEVF